MFQTAGKVAFITGALGALGKPCVRALLQNEVKGVMIVDCNDDKAESFVKELEVEFGDGKVAFAKADVMKMEEIRGVFDKTVEQFGHLDIVINNAGVGENQPKNLVQINLGSVVDITYLAMQDYLPKYKKDKEAVILNMSSLAGLLPFSLDPIYSATKSGLVFLGLCMKSKKDSSIKVLTLCPGFTDSPMASYYRNLPQMVATTKTGGLINMVQSPECVAEATVEVIKAGGNGSVWVVNNGRPPFEIDFGEILDIILKKVLDKSND